MATYTVTAWRDFTHSAQLDIEADTAKQAIRLAQAEFYNPEADHDWESCDQGGEEIHYMRAEPHFEMIEPPADEAHWHAPEELAKNAASDLLAALQECMGFLKGHQETSEKIARYERALAAIAKATTQPAP